MCLIFVSFIELKDFIIYGTTLIVNKRTKILPLASSHIATAYLCNQFNHVFALLISSTFQNQ